MEENMKNSLKTFLVILSLGNSLFASENVFNLKMDLIIEGKHVSSASLEVNEGKKGIVTQDNNGIKHFIEVVAHEKMTADNQETIHMNFIIGKIAEDGSRVILTEPEVIASPNKKAHFYVKRDDQTDFVGLKFIAKKVSF
jgi:hypothetical protein